MAFPSKWPLGDWRYQISIISYSRIALESAANFSTSLLTDQHHNTIRQGNISHDGVSGETEYAIGQNHYHSGHIAENTEKSWKHLRVKDFALYIPTAV